jgi:hypothetical protein
MSKDEVKRPRHSVEIERIDEQARVSDLPAAAAAHEAPKLLFCCPSLPRRLLLQGAEGSKVTLRVDDLLHGGGTESADQLVLQICVAHVEAQPFHVDASEVGAEARPLEPAPEVALLSGVTETREADVKPQWAEPIQELPYGLRTPNGHNRNALGVKLPTAALGECFERALVADPFYEHNRARRTESLVLDHIRIFSAVSCTEVFLEPVVSVGLVVEGVDIDVPKAGGLGELIDAGGDASAGIEPCVEARVELAAPHG